MNPEIRLVTCLIVAITAMTWLPVTSGDIFTSTLKVERMVTQEGELLEEFKRFVDNQYAMLQACTNFYQQRLELVTSDDRSNFLSELVHPNAVYKVIKKYVFDYSGVLGENFEIFHRALAQSVNQYLADWNDIRGARLSLVRLQNVYNLKPMDMVRGDYLGVQGPELDPLDAFEIGQTCFTEGKLNESLEWLNTSLTLYLSADGIKSQHWQQPWPTVGTIKALMGRVYTFMGNIHLAQPLYDEALRLDPASFEVTELRNELQSQPRIGPPPEADYFHNFSRLCSLENRHYPADPNHPQIVCRYREGYLPYYRFKEEILSVTPFATVIYDVITDAENDHLRHHVTNRLQRGQVGGDNSMVSDIRTSDLAWIWDNESEVARQISKRIEAITGLDTQQRLPGGPSSSEAFQIVNYGLGGHYEVHMDPFDTPSKLQELKDSGERVATFLMYLSDVQKGGATVFTRAGVSVAPVKNMALLWYNFDPTHTMDEMTNHAGCPVLIGQKWIANKWIWTYGNTFRRRCGLTPDVTQLDIEDDMKRGYV